MASGNAGKIREIARLLEKHRIKRVPVLREGRVVGIVSRANLLHALSALPDGALGEPSEDDRVALCFLFADFDGGG